MPVEDSLSLVLPVRNAEHTLANTLRQLLDVLPDLSTTFEILLIDQGSDDQTLEVAHDLAREYPQIQIASLPARRGRSAILDTAMSRASGDFLLVQDEEATVDFNKLHLLWRLRGSARPSAPPKSRVKPRLFKRLAVGDGIHDADTARVDGVEMICRDRSARWSQNSTARIVRTDSAAAGESVTGQTFRSSAFQR